MLIKFQKGMLTNKITISKEKQLKLHYNHRLHKSCEIINVWNIANIHYVNSGNCTPGISVLSLA